jgi:ubiquinone biosynthesis protein UbiJ
MEPRPQAALERLLRRFVAHGVEESPRAATLLAELQGRRLEIEVAGTPWNLVLEARGGTLTMQQVPAGGGAPGGAADARIRGTPLSLLALAGSEPRSVIQRGDVRIDGDAAVAERFRELLGHLRPDLEAVLSRLLGRSLAHVVVRTARDASGWARASAWTGAQNLAEYLAHERQALVSRAEAEQFLHGVDCLREQLDRADARVHALEQRLRALAGESGPA